MAVISTVVGGDDCGDPQNPMKRMQEMFGPGHVDQAVGMAVQACWMALLKERRKVEQVEEEIRRLVERAISNLREDIVAFGGPK